MAHYILPSEVISPKQHWSLIAVLDEGKDGTAALAIGRWDQELRLAMRWNGNEKNRIGNPQSRGLPTWFMLPTEYHEAILNSSNLTPDKLTLARGFFPKPV